ncbi:FCD domain-containing protein [Streptomyces sodiiphilus]|uniref:FCD domain-containing protein n=1 Tax=Streptomyces sodiiphilus TaxID=226217 RepID=A0ABN2PR60_9ACTN
MGSQAGNRSAGEDDGTGARHQAVLDTLGLEITGGALPAGHVLTLEGIQERFRVSRTVAREAMRLLESLGLVASRRRVGITVLAPASWNVFDPRVIWWRLSGADRENQLRSLTELRAAVEPPAAGAAARNASAEQRALAERLAARMRTLGEAGRLGPFLDTDIAFHTLLLRAGGNEMFSGLADVVAVVLRARTALGLMPPQPRPHALDLHEAVARAVASGRAAEAEAAMRELLAEVRNAVVPPGPPGPPV